MPHTQREGTSETENDAIADSLAERSIRIAIHVRRARPCGAVWLLEIRWKSV